MLNPYANRAGIRRPEDFFGRARELGEIYSLILGGNFVSLVGERRVGKTSILNALAFESERTEFGIPGSFRFVLLDALYFKDATEQDFLEALLGKLAEEADVPNYASRRESLPRVTRELRQQTEPKQLVILLDEVDVLVNNQKISPGFFSYLRAWMQEFRIPSVIASREGWIEMVVESEGAGSPFWNLYNIVYVGPFDEVEARELICTPAELTGAPFGHDEVQQILKLGGHLPFFLQIACYYMFQLKAAGAPVRENFERAQQQFRLEATPHFDYLFHRLGESEQKAVKLLSLEKIVPNGRVLSDLLRKGLLIQDSEGTRLFSVVFEDIVRAGTFAEAKEDGSRRSAIERFFTA
jgi:hypothetical protein